MEQRNASTTTTTAAPDGSFDGDGGRLVRRAVDVLRLNDAGDWTRAAPGLYPHQWSWDSAFITLGWAQVDPRRGARELERLFEAQWSNGMVPHIVYDVTAPPNSYFPGPDRWDCRPLSESAPEPPIYTSGICQPPVHALAASRLVRMATRSDAVEAWRPWARKMFERLVRWHRYLMTARDPEGSGSISIYHPWESGCDNSPRWDFVMGRLIVGHMPPYMRFDLGHVGDPSMRPSDTEYDFYVWLVEELKLNRYDDEQIHERHPFVVKDALFSAILVVANEALLELADVGGASAAERAEIHDWIARGRRGVLKHSMGSGSFAFDYDRRHDMPLESATIAALLCPLLVGRLEREVLAELLEMLDSEQFAGNPALVRPMPPSTSPSDPGFRPRSYWRGPMWPVINWLLWYGLRRSGAPERARRLRADTLAQVEEVGFAEYFDPYSGEPLGSLDQAWTAAVVLDWLLGDRD